jgi:hypothetical protein
MENGELLKKIYDIVSDLKIDVAVIKNEQENQGRLIDKHDTDIDKLKWKILPALGVISVIIMIVMAFIKK